MPPSADDFAASLATENLGDLVRDVVFDGLPFVFEGSPEVWTDLRQRLSESLQCEEDDVLVVGSAKMGYSLAPRKYGTPFADHSDIDVLIICPCPL